MLLLPFSENEYKIRIRNVKNGMAEQSLDVLVITEPANIYYLCGYDAWSFYTVQALIVFQNAELPIWVGRQVDSTTAHVTTFLPRARIVPYPDVYVQNVDRHASQFVADVILDEFPTAKVIGVEMDAYYYTARDHAELVKSMPNVRFADAELLVNWVRFVKSDAEVAYMRQAGCITELMMDSAVKAAMPGVRECDVAAAIYFAQMSGTETFGGLPSTSPPHMGFGSRAREAHPIFSDRPIAPDSVANIEISGCRLRYHAPMSRTIYFGRPCQRYRDLAAYVIDGIDASLEVVRPGASCEDVELSWAKSLSAHGVKKETRLGYSIGIAYTPTWGERTASLRRGDRTILSPGVAFHLMAGLWLEDTGITITQSFVVTDKGYEALTSTPRELIVKD
ncbi:M24 family metallopeptidase [Bradyrhizobium sp. CW4]|uniref:M24 family metallopeptidase n=1 Tax=Bradyrhizobium sp. CW4 TaxID=2782687 RepID=UPI001FF9D39F|nr:Xaa-Pro peptidase family protein [Bradyrhizobium sp. CW4]MCK1411539.1 M24 family metallopeptidase [Bradyrhizobium sp. CW4]